MMEVVFKFQSEEKNIDLNIKGDEHEISKAFGELLKDKEVQQALLTMFIRSRSSGNWDFQM